MSRPNDALVYSLDHVKKKYSARTVLDIDSLTIHSGELLVLLGPSGAGKSTLLRLLALLERPSAGVLQFFGETYANVHDPPSSARRRVTLLFQRPLLLKSTVRANVAYGLRLRGMNDSTTRIDNVLEQFGLQPLADANAQSLSGGELQRVALARALVIEPEVLLLDEPTANLDPYNVALIEETIRAYHATHSATIVIVTHTVFQARRLAERAGLLLEGKLIEVGAAQEFFESPRDARVAAFVRGEMIY
jgi:tungstate transport system ATP-binding protein